MLQINYGSDWTRFPKKLTQYASFGWMDMKHFWRPDLVKQLIACIRIPTINWVAAIDHCVEIQDGR